MAVKTIWPIKHSCGHKADRPPRGLRRVARQPGVQRLLARLQREQRAEEQAESEAWSPQLLPLRDAVPPVRGRAGRPRRKPDSLFAAMTTTSNVIRSEPVASSRRSPGEEHGTAPVWALTAGWSRGRLPGCTASAAYASAGNVGPTCTKPSSNSPAASSPTDSAGHCVPGPRTCAGTDADTTQ